MEVLTWFNKISEQRARSHLRNRSKALRGTNSKQKLVSMKDDTKNTLAAVLTLGILMEKHKASKIKETNRNKLKGCRQSCCTD